MNQSRAAANHGFGDTALTGRWGRRSLALLGWLLAAPLALAQTGLEQPVLGGEPPEVLSPEQQLHAAIEADDRDAVRALLASGVPVESREEHGRTPLYTAARMGRAELTLALLEAGAQPNSKNYAGISPLHIAAARGHTEALKVLLSNCAAVEAQDLQQRTPLFMAATRGHEEATQLLLANGADATARRNGGSTPVSSAASFRQFETARLLREQAQLMLALAAAGRSPLPGIGGVPTATEQLNGQTERVRFVQRRLAELGYDPGPDDGSLASRTRDAIRSFQQDVGQVASGELSPCLLERVERELLIRNPPPQPTLAELEAEANGESVDEGTESGEDDAGSSALQPATP